MSGEFEKLTSTSEGRFDNVKRDYSRADVERLRGTVRIEHSLARKGAERLWKSIHEEDFVHSLGAVTGGQAVQMAKAVETEVNAIVFEGTRRVLAERPFAARSTRAEGHDLDLGRPVPHQSLGVLKRLLEADAKVKKALGAAYPQHGTFLTDSYKLPSELEDLRRLRIPAAHSEALSADEVYRSRARLLGIGCHGLLPRLAELKVFYRAKG